MSEEKKNRSALKAKITRTINNIKRYIAEEDEDEVEENSKLLKAKFKEFEAAHETYNGTLASADETDESDLYFYSVQDDYIAALKLAKKWLNGDDSTPTTNQTSGAQALNQSDVMSLINLPKIELEVFDGDPMQYHSFMTMFDELVDGVAADDRWKLTRLIQYTSGKAKEAIRYCTLIAGGKGYQQAREVLHNRFGNMHLVTEKIIRRLRSGKQVRGPEELRQLSDELSCSYMTLSQMKNLQEMESQSFIVDIVTRLQPYLQIAWKKKALEFKNVTDQYPKFVEFVNFVKHEADNANDPVYGKLGQKPKPVVHKSDSKSKSSNFLSGSSAAVSVSANVTQSNVKWQRPPCLACGDNHKLLYCPKFKHMKPVDRLQMVKTHKLCEMCLLSNHVTENCRKLAVCGIDGCKEKHTKFIHVTKNVNETGGETSNVVTENTSNCIEVDNSNVGIDTCSNVHMPVVAVKVNNCHDTCALLDTASTNTFCTQGLVDALNIPGNEITYLLNTLGKVGDEVQSKVVSLTVSSPDGEESLYLPFVYVVDTIPVRSLQVDTQSFPFLKDLPLAVENTQTQILIGQDNAEALLPLEVRKGSKGQPFAVRTLFGWSVNGPANVKPPLKHSVISHFISANGSKGQMQSLWNLEHEDLVGDEYCMSQNEQKVVELWDKECVKVNGHYEIPIPWKPDVKLPINLVMARSRLASLKASLERKGLISLYGGEIQKLLSKGYAELVPSNAGMNLDKVWYLPHQAVITDKKPGKVRIVFDCAAKFQGESLNDNCYQGPDFNNKLLHVLLRFKQYSVAVMSDIEAMYNQVVVPVKDRDSLRFLWYDEKGNEVQYRMTRHLFGGVWCSSISTYALHRAVKDSIDCSPDVADTVLKSFYVDDCAKSVPTSQDALKIIHGTKSLLAEAGFRLTKFVSNNSQVLKGIPENDLANVMEGICPDSHSKALGVKWNVTRDTFCFDVKVDLIENLTRRKMLSTVASLFDPLGLVSPVVIRGKQLFQEATRKQLSWDELVPRELVNKWNVWISDVKGLMSVEVPRCMIPQGHEDTFTELHHFSDASMKSYGCCTYMRSIAKDGNIHVSFVVSKSKVAPIKQITIPRLELQAALLAAKVDYMLKRQLDFELAPSWFWVDSELVLKYINNESRKFHVFVGNRVSAIRQLTESSQWHHIGGKFNPADVVSRGQDMKNWDVSQWNSGPDFLWDYKNAWNIAEVDPTISDDDTEVRKMSKSACFLTNVEDSLLKLFAYYSSWYRLKRAVAWWLRLKERLKTRSVTVVDKYSFLTVSEIQTSEVAILKCAQWQFFAKEIVRLSKGEVVCEKSSIKSLDPFVDKDGLLRVGGRLGRASFDECIKHPYLLSHDHPISLLIVRQYHNVSHSGTEWIISQIRKVYWITRIRRIVKRVARECFACRKLFSAPCSQKMASLPPERLEAGKPPFSYVGIDCFGPILVKQGRSEVKRYGCLFTCLNIRAVHLEKLNSLDTDSFLNGFRRFISRRGVPLKVWSDNGTNFVGGKSELSKSSSCLDQDAIQSYGTCKGIEWHFNPPHASHMGGIWERMIRTVRKVLAGICSLTHKLSDESLETLFCEAESIINSRPLTKVSDSVKDPAALSPNHLLLLSEQPSCSPGVFDEVDVFKRRWRCVQHLANEFWRRWLQEYLPLLQTRGKWLKDSKNVQVGDLVLVMDENTPRGVWPLGIVEETYPSSDGLVRSVKIKTKVSRFVRPITKVVLLEGSSV